MPDLKSHDGRIIINTAVNSISIDGNIFMIEHEWGDYPVAATYTLEDMPSLKAELRYEEDGRICDPRSDRDNLGTFATFGHITRDYNIGDEQWHQDHRGDEFEIECPTCEGSGENDERWTIERFTSDGYVIVGAGTYEAMAPEYDKILADEESKWSNNIYFQRTNCVRCKGEQTIQGTVLDYVRIVYDAVVAVPVYVDPGHGANYGWCRVDNDVDDSTNGIVFVSKQDFIKEYGSIDDMYEQYTPEHQRAWGENPPNNNYEACVRLLTGEIEEMDKYLRGECYYSVIEDELSGLHESCGGLLGDDWAKEHLFWELADAIEGHQKEIKERAACAARDIETV